MKSPILPFILAAGPPLMRDIVIDKKFSMKRVIAVFLFGAIVWLLWDINTDVASAFAWVAALTSILINGLPVLQAVTKGL